jgi:2-oxoglutarate dehydrogenase E2 component (dihydrolipoamide succinyltransferase)
VEEFEPLVEVNTDKVDTEVPSPASGTVLKIYVEEGTTVEAGALLAMIGEQGEEVPEVPEGKAEPEAATPPTTQVAEAARPREAPEPGRGDLGFISPVVARMASEHDVDLRQVEGTGAGGRITKQDVLAHLETRQAEPERAPWDEPGMGELFRPTEEFLDRGGEAREPGKEGPEATPGELIPLDPVRKRIAEHMVQSKSVSPHVTTVMEADLSRVIRHRRENREAFARDGAELTFTAYFVGAAVSALRALPIVNASWTESGVQVHSEVNVGVAVSLGEQGLIVPVIKAADQQSLLGLAKSINDLARRARARQLSPEEVQGGTFTITNHGVSGSLFATPIINQPQCAIMGVGKIEKRVVVVEREGMSGGISEAIAIQPRVYLTLTFDHRIIDGAVADHFLGHVVSQLEAWG